MIKFQYLEPQSVEEAVGYLKKYGEEAKLKASGISLLLLMKQGIYNPRYLINLERISGLSYISKNGDGNLLIGAMTTHREIERSDIVRKEFYVLTEMEKDLGSLQIRNRGTIGGNVCHNDPFSDPPAVLVALGAKARIFGAKGERIVLFEDFFVDYYETVLEQDEVLMEIIIPKIPENAGCSYIKHTMRRAMDKPFVGASAYIKLDSFSSFCEEAKIVLTALATRPIRAREVEKTLIGNKLDESLLEQVLKEYEPKNVNYVYDIRCPVDYKKWVTPVIIKRAIMLAQERAVR